MSPPTSSPRGRPEKPAHLLDDVQPWEYTGNVAHPTEKAISVIKPLVETFSPPGGLVLDPFSGSGSTAVAAALAGRLYLGIELEEQYCQLARRRLGGVERFIQRRSQRLIPRRQTARWSRTLSA
jgi:DNA modification methylase